MKGRAEFIFETGEPDKIYQALAPEVEDEIHRSNVDLILGDRSVTLKIQGEDVVSLRAAVNTWIRLFKIAFEMVRI